MNSKKLISIILLLILLMAIPLHAFAAEATTAEIPFSFKNASGTVVVEAVNDEPLPEQTVFEGVSAGKFVFSFAKPGDYYYTIHQESGTEPGVAYDSTVYEVCIAVFVTENGDLYSVSAINTQGNSKKTDKVSFVNTSLEPGSEPSSEPTSEPSSETNSEPSSEPSTGQNSGTEPGSGPGTGSGSGAGSGSESGTGSNGSSDRPQTGDNNNLGLWVVLLFASLLGLAWFYFLRKKRNDFM